MRRTSQWYISNTSACLQFCLLSVWRPRSLQQPTRTVDCCRAISHLSALWNLFAVGSQATWSKLHQMCWATTPSAGMKMARETEVTITWGQAELECIEEIKFWRHQQTECTKMYQKLYTTASELKSETAVTGCVPWFNPAKHPGPINKTFLQYARTYPKAIHGGGPKKACEFPLTHFQVL